MRHRNVHPQLGGPFRITLPALLCLIAFAAVALAATCITGVQQRAPEGPWVGETVNNGDGVVHDVSAHAQITDATGSADFTGLGSVIALSCPSVLWPGEHGAFELRANVDWDTRPRPRLPLRATFDTVAFERPGSGAFVRDGLYVRYISRDNDARTVQAELVNNGDITYDVREICAVARDIDGNVAALGRSGQLTPPDGPLTRFEPGDTYALEWTFAVMPEGGSFQFHAQGIDLTLQPPCCMPGPASGWGAVDAGTFTVALPPGWEYRPLQGIDTLVGEFTGDGVTLRFDYGVFAGGGPTTDRQYFIQHETIGGYHAQIIYPRPGAGGETTGVFFADDLVYGGEPTRFNLVGENLNDVQRDIAIAIFRSIRFDPK